MDPADGDIATIFRHYEVDQSRFLIDLNRALDRLKTGNARAPALSPELVALAREAWLFASVEHSLAQVRSGHILWAFLADEALGRRARELSGQLMRIPAEALKRDFAAVTAASSEATTATAAHGRGCRYARDRRDDAIVSRRRLAAIYHRPYRSRARRQDRPDPGARQRDTPSCRHPDAATAEQPDPDGRSRRRQDRRRRGLCLPHSGGRRTAGAADVGLRTLDLGLLQAGAGIKGEFENRLKSVIEEVKASPRPIILFIDEAHTMIGAGGQPGRATPPIC